MPEQMTKSALPSVQAEGHEVTPRLEIRNIRRFFEGRAVVDDVSLTVLPGQVTCLLGPSGCGKSTTLRMIAGVEMQDSGTIHVDGKLICDTMFRVPPERREIGLMFQDFALFPHLSVADNVGFGLKKGTKAEKRKRIEELLERVDLLRYIDGYPHQLSGGEQQMLAFGRAMIARPELILMDEPSLGLAPKVVAEIFDTIKRLNQEDGTAILLVEQNAGVAFSVADYGYIMESGQIVMEGDVAKLRGDKDIQSFYLGMGEEGGARQSFRDVKHYKRRKRWLS